MCLGPLCELFTDGISSLLTRPYDKQVQFVDGGYFLLNANARSGREHISDSDAVWIQLAKKSKDKMLAFTHWNHTRVALPV